MEIIVIWSDSAIEELQGIYDHYHYKASRRIANKLVNDIVDQTLLLEHSPRIGQTEEILGHLQKEIRYLVHGNYKIVYWIDENVVTIATVFDCRQNPEKLGIKRI